VFIGNAVAPSIGGKGFGTAESGRSVAPTRPRAMSPRPASPSQQHADLLARELPLELGFLAVEGFSPDSLLNAVSLAPDAVEPVDQLLNEGKINEEIYYRALANYLGCQYYCGDPPLARTFDPVKGCDVE
jgi:hypothetical protein